MLKEKLNFLSVLAIKKYKFIILKEVSVYTDKNCRKKAF